MQQRETPQPETLARRRFACNTLVSDIDGVLYRGLEPICGVADVYRSLEADGVKIIFATNNSTKTEEMVVEAIRKRTGFETTPDRVVTSGLAAARHLAGDVDAAYVVGGAGLPIVLEREGVPVTSDWQTADVVVVGLDPDINYEKLTSATYALNTGVRFVATNHDPTFPTPIGFAPGAGSIVAALERSSGRSAEIMGKPFAPFGEVVSDLATGSVVMVGDRIDSDMALARAQGWAAILVMTGVTDAAAAATADVDAVIADATGLLELLR